MKTALQRLFREATPRQTQEQIAANSDLKLGSIKNWMIGRNDPKVSEFIQFGVALGYTREYTLNMLLEVVRNQR